MAHVCNFSIPREEIPAAVGRPASLQRDGFIRRGALAPAARAL